MGIDLRRHDSISRVNAKSRSHLIPFNKADGALISCNDNPIYIIGLGNRPTIAGTRTEYSGYDGDWGDSSSAPSFNPTFIGTDKPNDGDTMTFLAWSRGGVLLINTLTCDFAIKRVNTKVDWYRLQMGGLIISGTQQTVGITMVYSGITDLWHVTSNTSITT